jgi:hypothetical protein
MLGRAGYAAKGIVYVVMGALAAKVAFGAGGKDHRHARRDRGDRRRTDGDDRTGRDRRRLLGYMLWRLIAAATDAEGEGDEPTKLVVRGAQAGRGIAYGVLGVQALRALGGDDVGLAGRRGAALDARLLDMPFGRALVVGVGLGVLGYAAYQLYRAFSDKARSTSISPRPVRRRRPGSCASAGSASPRAAWCSR